jgi:NOP protein chaperone 1
MTTKRKLEQDESGLVINTSLRRNVRSKIEVLEEDKDTTKPEVSGSTDEEEDSDSAEEDDLDESSVIDPPSEPDEDSNDTSIFAHPRPVTQYESSTGVTTIRVGAKPRIDATSFNHSSDLMDKLKAFLPRIAAANEELDAEREAGTLAERVMEVSEDDAAGGDAEGGQYIEMVS